MNFNLSPLGDNAVIVEFGEDIDIKTQQKVKTFTRFLDDNPFPWMIEYVPAFTTVSIFYDPMEVLHLNKQNNRIPYEIICQKIGIVLTKLTIEETLEPRVVEIPVCYGGDFGPDLDHIAEHNEISAEEVIKFHSEGDYLVYMIGFAPGFPYIGGMSERIATPRRKSPRLKIPAGSVGIAGKQTGVYPIETPGGWQLIGKTPLKLFRPLDDTPSLLKAGDKIRFKPISFEKFKELEAEG
ncbi:5-oxoprolinase subunit PxpB [Pseudalkalibacillus caeni]|uniref:5-oxoprolinase subunit PxpB n=1 Tax=Exobacillus caeni TaxID=2574798 RepID=A0A5R9FAH9_9BACL|nr:5-oxoprolinase subunit PxpB [Pseudalkalibacillus caeni]TLS38668.1 5-oxoprolinase subunit PxpB [Pseudalkalibacillus caeni]